MLFRSDAGNYGDGLTARYNVWISSGLAKFFNKDSAEESERAGVVQRASLIQIFALAQELVPGQKPFLLQDNTYSLVPTLMVPRVFWPDKMRGTAPSEKLAIYLGIQSVEQADFTGIAVGQLAEAWINFGWVGLVVAGLFCGFLFGYPAQITIGLSPVHVGWLGSCIFFVYSGSVEQTIPEIICSLANTLLLGLTILFIFSKDKAADLRSGETGRSKPPPVSYVDIPSSSS